MVIKNHLSSFFARRINKSTFAITEDDRYGEHPVLYAKLYPNKPVMVLSDTGLNSPHKRSKEAKFIHIRDFLEHCPVPSNDNQPLNPDGRKQYVILVSHCHYDHILGLPSFYEQGNAPAPPVIVSSLQGKQFVTHDIWEHSLCRLRNLPKPDYRPTHFAADGENLVLASETDEADGLSTASGIDLDITVFNTPGHVPDEIAWYDRVERHLYVGDSIYETGDSHGFPGLYPGPIEFPKEGNWVTYVGSMKRLLFFVQAQNLNDDRRVKLGAAHNTVDVDAEEVLEDVLQFFGRVVRGNVEVIKSDKVRGEEVCWWDEGGRFAVRAPLRLCEEYRRWNKYFLPGC